MDPSWPVFIAARRSKHSWPRISPRMIRSGRMRSALMTRSRMVIAPWPSRFGGRVSSGSQCGCCSRSSAASSIVITRSPGSIIFDRALSMVVLPEPVPPEMMTFMRQAPAIFSTVAIFSDIEPNPRIMSSVIGFSENLRIEMAVPRSDSGGMMTFTRLPSWRRASARGVVWSTRRPTLLTMRWAIWNRCSSSRNWILASSSLPLRSMKVWSGPLTMMSLTAGSASSSSSGPSPNSSSTSTFSSAKVSRRLRLIFSSASTSEMIGRNSSASSSLPSVAAASGSTRSSRRGRTCSLMRWTEASKPSLLLDARSPLAFWRSLRRSIAPPGPTGIAGALPCSEGADASGRSSTGGN